MPVYACYRGDCDNLALQQGGRTCFLAKDAFGREWVCVETDLKEIPGNGLPGGAPEVLRVQAAAHRQGFSGGGTSVSWIDCPDEGELRRRLVLGSYPPRAESQARLRQAGWIHWQSTNWGEGDQIKVMVGDGRSRVEAEGETDDEAWYRAARKALGA